MDRIREAGSRAQLSPLDDAKFIIAFCIVHSAERSREDVMLCIYCTKAIKLYSHHS